MIVPNYKQCSMKGEKASPPPPVVAAAGVFHLLLGTEETDQRRCRLAYCLLWSSLFHKDTAFTVCDSGPGFGIGPGKSHNLEGFLTLSFSFRLFLGHLGSGRGREGGTRPMCSRVSPWVHQGSSVSSFINYPLCTTGSRLSFSPLDTKGIRQQGGGISG